MTPEVVLAVDVGGTKMALALVDDEGTVLAEDVRPTLPDPDPLRVVGPLLEGIAALAARLPDDPGPLRVGVSSAGPLDGPAGTVSPVNIGAWRDFPLVEHVRAAAARATGREALVGLANDGHCFTLGEHWLGAGRDVASMVGMVLSTGVGAGAVLDGPAVRWCDRQRRAPGPHQRQRLGRAVRVRRPRLRRDVRPGPGDGRGGPGPRLDRRGPTRRR